MSVLLIIAATMVLFTGCTNKTTNKDNFQGMIESESIDINSKIPGRISDVKVEEGAEINVDQLIVTIDADTILAKKEGLVAQAEAAEAAAEAANAVLNKAKDGARVQDIAKAQAAYDLYKKSYDRVLELYNVGAVSESKVDEVKTKMIAAKETLGMAKEGARAQDIEAAAAQVAAAKAKHLQALAGVKEVETYIHDSNIKSPIAGILTSLNASAGEIVSTGMNIATITNLDNTWVEINVDETQIARFKENQKVKVTTLAYKDKEIEGVVVTINQLPDFAVKRASNENGEFDLVSYGVKVKIDNKEHLFRPGMTAFVKPE